MAKSPYDIKMDRIKHIMYSIKETGNCIFYVEEYGNQLTYSFSAEQTGSARWDGTLKQDATGKVVSLALEFRPGLQPVGIVDDGKWGLMEHGRQDWNKFSDLDFRGEPRECLEIPYVVMECLEAMFRAVLN